MSGEREWYAGVVTSYSSRRGHCVAYENGEFRNEDLDDWDASDFERLKDDDAPKTEVRLGGGWAVLWVPRANKSKTPGDWYAYRRDDPNRLYRSQRELLRALPVGRGCIDSNDRGANGDSASEISDVDSGNVDQRNIVTGRRHRAAAN
ncbi:hypothetical protein EMIHUDRAFT_197980 [Emiliania huxleyi CCMP1516]|uniref:Uncharacterized protein n=2 Tax=Emiliania huxleyi TaxID=2903 RepID=A0A0D3IE23_EMIH1|nr:hypothetical protein EMIHUDRAFT_197980 [Emiliania huxleyi CCMP1516]EOD09508.1 hypothetical protein EMIHUDRAFT_197980 [Emiliania huxleyi CCMP1516]|eukprot:XP_005761937.1 hypothetical protein EMIHUDRAFT_197980 [Emiliania huxleyi CCMP1516]